MPTTADQPKCFAKVNGKRILDWIIEAISDSGIEDICFIGGYQIEKVQTDYPGLTFRHNQDWRHNNILESLMYAQDQMDEPFICCYSDILFSSNLISSLAADERDISLAVDTGWMKRYQFRTEHPPDDAEKVTVANGVVTHIHRNIDPAQAYGEYTGVAKFSASGAAQLTESYARCKKLFSGKPFREAKVFEKAYKIHLFQEMIENSTVMHHVDTHCEYMEIDTQQDFDLAQKQWNGRVVFE